MQQENLTINISVPTGWDKLDDHQLRYVFGLLAQGFPSPQVKTYCLFRWTGMQVMHKYGKGWWCKFADDEFVIMAEQVNSAIAALDWIDSLPSKPVRISRIGKHRALTELAAVFDALTDDRTATAFWALFLPFFMLIIL